MVSSTLEVTFSILPMKKNDRVVLTIFTLLAIIDSYLGCGAVAQLGERLNGIQEADGSIPFSSTIFSCKMIHHRMVDFFIYATSKAF